MNWIDTEIKYFSALAAKAPPVRWGRFVPFKVTFKMGSPVCVTTPWVSFDGLLAHLMLMDAFGRDFFITPKKLNLMPYLPMTRHIPLKKTGAVHHASVSQFEPYSVRVTQIYKRFEERWAERLNRRRIHAGSGHFRAYAMRQPYIPCEKVVFYACGDMDIVQRFIEEYLVGLGNDTRIGFGAVRDVQFENLDEDRSLVADGVAMRPIPVEMCADYDDAAYLPYRPPYWAPENVVLCVPPGARCRLRDELGRG